MTTPEAVLSGEARWCIVPGDALAALASLPSASVDAVITDAPYSSGGQFRGDRAAAPKLKYQNSEHRDLYADFSGDNRDQRSYGYWSALWLSEALRVAKPGAPICCFTDWRQLPTTTDALQAGGWTWRGIVVWDKTEGCRPQKGRFASQCEYVIWGSNGGMVEDRGVGCLSGVVRAMPRAADKHHIAGKPTDVMRALVEVCVPGGMILDPFAGSATTGVAALLTGRRFIGCELGETWIAVARERLAAEESGLTLQAARAGQVPMFRDKESA